MISKADEAMAKYELARAAADDKGVGHTPTPWNADKLKIYADALPPAVPHWPFDPFVAIASNEQNAAFIARACNAYDENKKLIATLAQIVYTQNGNKHEDINELLDRARKASV